ncbi:MAG: hypothetical protein J7507_08870 [Pseudoxanthomonas sp.]|nr:hypothetical protein [Pseudoxanthomonas sp.]
MSSRTLDACLLAFALVLVSCGRAPANGSSEPALHDRAMADPALEEPPQEEPQEDVPPATVPDAAAALAPLAEDFDAAVPVPFGRDPQALRVAMGGNLKGDAGEAGGCHFLFQQPRPAHGYGTAFMIEDGRFVRMDVDDPAATAPGGGRVGMDATEIAALYPGRVEERPHKYVEGAKYLRVSRDGSATVLLFETDAQGRVRSWRIGQPPQVDYVEGCG